MEMHIIFKGKVQGVGFRWTVVEHAEKLNLKGTVKNLEDGSVEVFAQGSEESVKDFLECVRKEPGYARVESILSTHTQTQNTYTKFCIIP